MQKILVLFEKDHLKGLPIDVFNKLEMDLVIYPFKLDYNNGIFSFIKLIKNKNLTFFILDYQPLAIQFLLSKLNYRNFSVNYIQHGHFEKNIEINFRKNKIKYYFNSIVISLMYIFLSDKEYNIFQRIIFTFQYFVSGSNNVIEHISSNKQLDNVFLINKRSKDVFTAKYTGKMNNIDVVGRIDSASFIFDENAGTTIYVSQPLHLTGHVSEKNYINYIEDLILTHPNIIILGHPKIDSSFFKTKKSKITVIRKEELREYPCSSVIGHFSSILLGLNPKINLKLEESIDGSILKEVKLFDPYKTISGGLEKINEILNNNG